MLRAFLYFFVLWVFGWSNRELQDFDVCKIRPIFGPWRNGDLLYATGTRGLKNSFILISSVSIPAQISLRDHHDDMMKLDLVAIGVSHVFPMGPWAGRYYLVVWRLVTSHILYHHISSFSVDNPLSA